MPRAKHLLWFSPVWLGLPALLGAGGLAVPVPSAADSARPTERPNIIVVMTDDQTAEELADMPSTNELLAGGGVTFKRAFVSYPVCCPSRATYLTGQYAHNHGVMGLYPPTGGYGRLDKANTLPVWLQRAGYHTSHIGKFLNGYGDQQPADVPPGWDDWHATVDYSTYRMWGYTLNDNGRFRTYGSPFDEQPGLYQTHVLTDKALSVIDERSGRVPFFLSLNFLAPHHEDRRIQQRTGRIVRAAPGDEDVFASSPLPLPVGFNERDISDKPSFLRRRAAPLTQADIARIGKDALSRRDALLAVDRGVGRIVSALRARRELDNTYILFTSDNGYLQGQHRVPSGKMLPYDPSTKVPLLIRGPGIPAGRSSGELVANIDLAPTLLQIARAWPSITVDGRSLLPFARHPGRRTRRAILHETGGRRYVGLHGQDEAPNRGRSLRRVLTYRAVRSPGWLYVRYRGGTSELYDLRRDPHQLRSRHRDPAYRATRRALASELRRLAHCSGAVCRRRARPIPRPR
jgi:N-acetylglucosamine-6-sulfatase